MPALLRFATCSFLFTSLLLMPARLDAADRLPRNVTPRHYALQLKVAPGAPSFSGVVRLDIDVAAATSRVILNAADLVVSRVTVRQAGQSIRTSFHTDAPAETLTLELAAPLAPGPGEISIDYTGPIRSDLRGLYASHAGGRNYAVTQFEPTDARRMFPSFDEPDFKATFAMTAIVPRSVTAISNGRVVAERPGPAPDEHTFVFGETAPMSTYLVALAVGEFACRERAVDAVPVRVCATPDNAALTGLSLDVASDLLRYYNGYFQIRYPFGKLDLVAIPDFAAGAMENTGAIFFRESLLLIDPTAATTPTRKRAATVIAHEMAHQWFGDLVTMRWWDDLWLNEGFATWMETKAVDALHPEWHVDLDAIQQRQAAMSVDVLGATRPVKLAAQTPSEINQLFDPIAYDKGGAILTMTESYVGGPAFAGAINAYLARHRYGNATSEDFGTAMAQSTGKPVDRIISSFVTHSGMPLLAMGLSCVRGETRITLAQTPLPNAPVDPQTSAPGPLWALPTCLRAATPNGEGAPRCDLLDARSHEITLDGCSPWVYGNAGQQGYYRSTYAPGLLSALTEHVGGLAASERLGFAVDLWSDVRRSTYDVGAYLNVADAIATDRSAAVVRATASRLRWIGEYLTTPDTARRFASWVRSRYEAPHASSTGGNSTDDALERDAAITLTLGTAGEDTAILDEARQRVGADLAQPDGAHAPGVMFDVQLALAARHGDRSLYDSYVAAATRAATPEQRYRFLYALADFEDPALVTRTIDLALSDAIRSQDAALVIGAVLNTPVGRRVGWPLIRQRWPEIDAKVGSFAGVGRIVQALGGFCDEHDRESVRAFFAAHPVAQATRTLGLALEEINACAVVRHAQTVPLQRWLDSRDATTAR